MQTTPYLKTLAFALACSAASCAAAMTPEEKDAALASYVRQYYVSLLGNGFFLVDTERKLPDRFQFWRACEQIEAIEDAYDRTKSPLYRQMVGELLNGLNNVLSGTTDFASWNEYNDDVMWACIALARGYEITGNRAFLDQAEWQFNKIWDRAWDTQLGGGLWWRTDNQTKNACVNGPAAIAAMILARNTVGTGYREQAYRIFAWLRSTLVNTDTGQVYDHIQADGTKIMWAFTYNQGTYAGAATLLYEDSGKGLYRSSAANAVRWARANLTGQHTPDILNDEYDGNGGNGDPVGFKGIFVRWAAHYARVAKDDSIGGWLTANADAAWSYRNSSGLMWGQWWRRTPDGYLTSWECSSALAISQCAP